MLCGLQSSLWSAITQWQKLQFNEGLKKGHEVLFELLELKIFSRGTQNITKSLIINKRG